MNMSQKRASFALKMVSGTNKSYAEEIRNHAAKLIALIQTSGFLQSMDFAFNKMKPSDKKMKNIHQIIQLWLAKPFPEGPGFSDQLMEAATNEKFNDYLTQQINSNEYRRAMVETVALLGWLKSKAEGRKNELSQENPQEENDQ